MNTYLSCSTSNLNWLPTLTEIGVITHGAFLKFFLHLLFFLFKERLDREFQEKLERNQKEAEDRTAKKRAKRLRKKQKLKEKQKQKKPRREDDDKTEDPTSTDDSESEDEKKDAENKTWPAWENYSNWIYSIFAEGQHLKTCEFRLEQNAEWERKYLLYDKIKFHFQSIVSFFYKQHSTFFYNKTGVIYK